jgi:hypothetical protein
MNNATISVKAIRNNIIESAITVLKVAVKSKSHKVGQLNQPRSP